MFFVKALGGALLAVFGGLYMAGFFGNFSQEAVIEDIRQAEIASNKDAAWGPHCDSLRDKVMGVDASGAPAGLASTNPMESIAKLAAAERKLAKAGCDIDAAPGAFSPFEPDKNPNRGVSNAMEGDGSDGSEWGGDPNAFNKGGSDDWGGSQ